MKTLPSKDGLISYKPQSLRQAIDDELDFHIELARREAESQGLHSELAMAQARKQFGDFNKIRTTCLQIAWKERLMEKLFSPALTTVVFLGLIGVAFAFFYQAHAKSRMALEARMAAEHAHAVAAMAQEREAKATGLITEILQSSDGTQNDSRSINQILEVASAKIAGEFADQPEVLEKLQRVIANAKLEIQASNETADDED